MLWQVGVRNVSVPFLNVGEMNRESGSVFGAAVLLVPLMFGRTRRDEKPLGLLVMQN